MGIALVTGASAGLGTEFARLFAADGHDVVLVARRRERLDALAAELAGNGKQVRTHVIALDLGAPDAVKQLTTELARRGLEIDFLVNNAGFGKSGAFHAADEARQLEMVQLNVNTLVALTRALLPAMVARGRGRVLNIGSTAGFQPGPFMAVYYASKAFVNSFTEALWYELKGTGVTATVSCPGATATEFGEVAGNDKSRLFMMGAARADVVARQAYKAMHAGRAMVVHGAKNKLAVQSLRVSPRSTVRAIAGALNKAPLAKQLEP
jgi:short-subunit dehydrogenase